MMTPPAATVRRADEVPFTTIAVGTDAAVQVLVGPAQGDTGYVTRRFRMGSGGGMPLHTNLVEHQQYVLCGRARITIGREVHEVGADHTLFIPAGVPHSYEVLDGPFEFLCIVPDRPDQIALLEQC
jgi:quercetin dioxygenase-like cupin family protein